MNCNMCGANVVLHETRCHVCQADTGFPHIRKANEQGEKDALAKRLHDAFVSAKARGCESLLNDFGRAVAVSKAVMCRPLGTVRQIIESNNALIIGFYGQVIGGSRLPEDNRFDRSRPSVDGLLFPYYHDQITFAAVSLDQFGVGGVYGGCHITLKETAIAGRSAVFEENSFLFCTTKHRIVVGGEVPPGYRAAWASRSLLAQAKHHSDITISTTPAEFPGILLHTATRVEDEVFIEVHIYGGIHREAIEGVASKVPADPADQVIWNAIKDALVKHGASVTELP